MDKLRGMGQDNLVLVAGKHEAWVDWHKTRINKEENGNVSVSCRGSDKDGRTRQHECAKLHCAQRRCGSTNNNYERDLPKILIRIQ